MLKLAAATAFLVLTRAILVAALASRPIVAIVPLAAGDPGLPYAPLPLRSQLQTATAELREGLRRDGLSIVAENRVAALVSRMGFNQSRPERSCSVVECAQKIGRALGADYVVLGTLTRVESVIWGTEISVVDVRTGKALREFDAVTKGDAQSTELAARHAGDCAARIITREKPCAVEKSM